MKNILVIGGAGYVGSLLCPQLIELGHTVSCYDICYFGTNFLPMAHPRFKLTKGDVRDIRKIAEAMRGIEVVIHLACISNDASFELDEQLSTSINLDAFEPVVRAAKAAGVRCFVFASSASVYGLSDQPDVTEDHPLVPLTFYNKYKGMCEPLMFKQLSDDFVVCRDPTCDAVRLCAPPAV